MIGIYADTFNISSLESDVRSTLIKYGKKAQRDFERTTRFFDTVKPIFNSTAEDNNFSRLVIPKRDENGKVWSFLCSGTKIRYATMSEDFEAKTTPGTFETGAGDGELVYVDTDDPRPGIQARNWHELVVKRYTDPFCADISKALQGL